MQCTWKEKKLIKHIDEGGTLLHPGNNSSKDLYFVYFSIGAFQIVKSMLGSKNLQQSEPSGYFPPPG